MRGTRVGCARTLSDVPPAAIVAFVLNVDCVPAMQTIQSDKLILRARTEFHEAATEAGRPVLWPSCHHAYGKAISAAPAILCHTVAKVRTA